MWVQMSGLNWNGIEPFRESFKRMAATSAKGRDFSGISFLSSAGFKSVDSAGDPKTRAVGSESH